MLIFAWHSDVEHSQACVVGRTVRLLALLILALAYLHNSKWNQPQGSYVYVRVPFQLTLA